MYIILRKKDILKRKDLLKIMGKIKTDFPKLVLQAGGMFVRKIHQ